MNPEQQTPPPYQPAPEPQPQPPFEPQPQSQPEQQQQPQQPQPEQQWQPQPQSQPEFQQFPQQPTPMAPTAATPVSTDPGKGLGIAGFILAFIAPIVGLPLSIVGYRKSRKNGFKNGLALAGIILNSVFLVGSILVFLLITMVAYNGIGQKAKTVSAQAAATSIDKKAEAYAAEHGDASGMSKYPTKFADLSLSSTDGKITAATAPLTSAPAEPGTVEFNTCDNGAGNKIGYWDYQESTVKYIYAGQASADSQCTLAN